MSLTRHRGSGDEYWVKLFPSVEEKKQQQCFQLVQDQLTTVAQLENH